MTALEQQQHPLILIVDDDSADREFCKRLLTRALDCTLLEASSCAQGLELFESAEPDLVLLDYYMGPHTALDFLAAARKEPSQPAPVVVLTGEGSESVAVEVMRHGALDYLPKNSMNGRSLHRATANALEKASMYRELRRKTADLARAHAAAESANRAKGAFLANVSHEIRTPLTAIMGYAEELTDPVIVESARQQAAACVLQNSEHLLHLINDLLDLSKIEAGKMEVVREPVSPFEVAQEVCQLLEARARDQGITLALESLTDVPAAIESDATRLRQILFNLVGNAVKFTTAGTVRVTLSFAGEALQIAVIDSGIGMSAEQVQKLFQPFVQADVATQRRFGGTGLGLSISKQLVELLGGRVSVESESGRGSTFTVRLPTGPVAASQLLQQRVHARQVFDAAQGDAAVSLPQLSGRVLLAEDVAANRLLIERILVRFGAEVVAVENGAEAAELALASRDSGAPFDVVLMDMQMPVMNGYDATGKLRAAGYTGPIVALTADAMVEDVERCLAAGCDAHASKPIRRQGLLELLAGFLPTR